MWDALKKSVLKGKFIATNACIRKKKDLKINHLSLHLRKLEKEEQINSKQAERKK